MREFAGKVAVVTGSGGGIGRALVERFTAEGMKAVVADIDPALVEQTTAELGDQDRDVIGVVTDVTDLAAVEALRDRTLEAETEAKIRARSASQIEQTAPDYLLVENLMTGKKAGAAD